MGRRRGHNVGGDQGMAVPAEPSRLSGEHRAARWPAYRQVSALS
jgi:hypothetical protein